MPNASWSPFTDSFASRNFSAPMSRRQSESSAAKGTQILLFLDDSQRSRAIKAGSNQIRLGACERPVTFRCTEPLTRCTNRGLQKLVPVDQFPVVLVRIQRWPHSRCRQTDDPEYDQRVSLRHSHCGPALQAGQGRRVASDRCLKTSGYSWTTRSIQRCGWSPKVRASVSLSN